MKSIKSSNLAALVAFCLIATLLTCTVAIAAGNMQLSPNDEPDSGKAEAPSNGDNGNTDENNEGNQEGDGDTGSEDDLPVVAPLPEFFHSITGISVSEEQSLIKPYCFVTYSSQPLYGISYAYLTVEIPTENEQTRFLSFTDNTKLLGKLGAMAPIREYMISVGRAFGANILAYGTDGKDEILKDAYLDFKKNLGYHYTEYEEYAYTNADLIEAFIKRGGASTTVSAPVPVPWQFTDTLPDNGATATAKSVCIEYGEENRTSFNYDESKNAYTLIKNEAEAKDMLNGSSIEYTNIFVLYADSTTYETENSVYTEMNTNGSGKGLYISGGACKEFKWSYGADGALLFKGEDGNVISVARGTAYIAYVKASGTQRVTVS